MAQVMSNVEIADKVVESLNAVHAGKSIVEHQQGDAGKPLINYLGDYAALAQLFSGSGGKVFEAGAMRATGPLILASSIYKASNGTAKLDTYADIAALVALKVNLPQAASMAAAFSLGFKTGDFINEKYGAAIDARIGEYSQRVGDYFSEKTGSVEFGGVMAAVSHSVFAVAVLPQEFEFIKKTNAWISEQRILDPAFKVFDTVVSASEKDFFAPVNDYFSKLKLHDSFVSTSFRDAREMFQRGGAVQSALQINIDTSPLPEQKTKGDKEIENSVSDGFVIHHPTHSVKFTDETLNKTDFVSAQVGGFASGGIRPGAFQLDPNVKPNSMLAQFYLDNVPSSGNPDFGLSNAVALNGLAGRASRNVFVDPLLLDLGGGGIGMTDVAGGVLFDIDNSGSIRRTSWTDQVTGILVMDSGDGKIKHIGQIFSEYYKGAQGVGLAPGEMKYSDGFAALASEDDNQDGVLDERDTGFVAIKVWVDANHDGEVDSGELQGLAALGISSIGISSSRPVKEDIAGNPVVGRGTFIMRGVSHDIVSVKLVAEPFGSTVIADQGGFKISSQVDGVIISAFQATASHGMQLDAAVLGVSNIYGGVGDDTLIASSRGGWLVGGAR